MQFRGSTLSDAITETDIPFWPKKSGKVRDIYDTGENLLIVATDRISAYDSILGNGIPCKGRVLTQLSLFWFDFLKDITENHVIETDLAKIDKRLLDHADALEGRTMLVRKADVIPIECVMRGYLAGSGWRSYAKTGEVCGIVLPDGLKESDRLPELLFTPATKAESGHDENIPFERMVEIAGAETASGLRHRSIGIYEKASRYARNKGVIIADTKFEFGMVDGGITLIDEVLTPDSSRFWPADDYEPGRSQKSFDKQYVRDYLDESGWDHSPPAPALPDEVVVKTLEKYVEAYERLTLEAFKV